MGVRVYYSGAFNDPSQEQSKLFNNANSWVVDDMTHMLEITDEDRVVAAIRSEYWVAVEAVDDLDDEETD